VVADENEPSDSVSTLPKRGGYQRRDSSTMRGRSRGRGRVEGSADEQRAPESVNFCEVFTLTSSCIEDGGSEHAVAGVSESRCKDAVLEGASRMVLVEGKVGERCVRVLRDTGCSCVIVRRSLVRDDQLLGFCKTCILVDGSKVETPVAKIYVESPYYTGVVEAMCMETPIYDVTIGNIEGAKGPSNEYGKNVPRIVQGLSLIHI